MVLIGLIFSFTLVSGLGHITTVVAPACIRRKQIAPIIELSFGCQLDSHFRWPWMAFKVI